MVDKIENIEPPLAHMVPEGAGHIVLPIVEYIEGIEVIKAFGRAGVSYEKYAKAITDFRTFVLKWLSSTQVTMKLAFALFPSTLIGTLSVSLYLASCGKITVAEAALAVMLSLSMEGRYREFIQIREKTEGWKI